MTTGNSHPPSERCVIEYHLGGWPALLNWALLVFAVACIFAPSNWLPLLHWPVLSAVMAMVLASVILRNSPWSPFYLGPTLSIGPDGITGRGGFTEKPWHVTWLEFERAEWGRSGIFVYRKGMKPWQTPCLQTGPFNCSAAGIVKAIHHAAQVHGCIRAQD